jgi:hypothetical protein
LFQEALHIGFVLFGGEQPVGRTGCQKRKKVIFLSIRIQKKCEEITKKI